MRKLPTFTHRHPRLVWFLSWITLMVFTICTLWIIKINAEEPPLEIDCLKPEWAGRCIDKTKPPYEPESQPEPTSHNVPDTQLPQFSVDNPVDEGDKWGK